MAELTSGTIDYTQFGPFIFAVLEVAATTDDGDVVNLSTSNFIGSSVAGVVHASGVRDFAFTGGTAALSPIGFDSGTAAIRFSNSGTSTLNSTQDVGSVSNLKRSVFIVAKSYVA